MTSPTRRRFLQSAAAATAGAWIAPRVSIARPGPPANSRINLAFIGVAHRGAISLAGFPDDNVVALCDVDDRLAAPAYDAHPRARRFRDFREMLDKAGDGIDAVVISTPDHTHHAAAMAAMALGEHVFCEKPLAHTVGETRNMKAAAARHGVITQMGNQGRATEGIRFVREWVKAGVLGEVVAITAWFNAINFDSRFFSKPASFPPPAKPVPGHFDWDLWLGPVETNTPYNPIYHPRTWRGFYEFGGGLLGDWSCHTLDAPYWALDLGPPAAVEAVHKEGGSTTFAPASAVTRFEFPARNGRPPVVMDVHEGGSGPAIRPEWGLEKLDSEGMIITGTEASLMTGGRPNNPRLLPGELWQDFRRNLPERIIPRVRGGHFREWADAIRNGGPAPGSSFDYAAGLTEMALLGVLAQRFGGRIEYDARTMEITNRPELTPHLAPAERDGWRFPA